MKEIMNMKKSFCKLALVASVALFTVSCGSGNSEAQKILDAARAAYQAADYAGALQQIDSLKKNYSSATTEIRAALALQDSARRADNEQRIELYTELITQKSDSLEALKKDFVYIKDVKLDDLGTFYPKETFSKGLITTTMLRSGVNEEGVLFLENIFMGNTRHNRLTISDKNGNKAETLEENGDGLNYILKTPGTTANILRFSGATENGVAKFIADNTNNALTATLDKDNRKASYTLSANMKKGVAKSYQLSTLILQRDSLVTEKEKALLRNQYLDDKAEKKTEEE